MYYIYEIYNDVTQRRYIGVSKRPTIRFQQHLNQLRKHTHTAEGINEDYVMFGEEHFIFRLIDTASTKQEGLLKEKRHIINNCSYNPEYGYNGNDPRWSRKPTSKPILDSELKKAIEGKGYKLSDIPWILDIRYSTFVTKMNHQELFTADENFILQDLIKNSPTDWNGRHKYSFEIRERRRG